MKNSVAPQVSLHTVAAGRLALLIWSWKEVDATPEYTALAYLGVGVGSRLRVRVEESYWRRQVGSGLRENNRHSKGK